MGNLLHLHDAHEQAQMLLPWHVNGTLDPAEAAWFEAHLAQCAECRADLEANRALRTEVASPPLETPRPRVPVLGRVARAKAPRAAPWQFLRRRITLGWALAGQAAFAAAAVAVFLAATPTRQSGEYQLLASEPGTAPGNVIVLFSPDTTEQDLRGALVRSGGRLVDGPTASGAYVVRVPAGARDKALGRLREMPQVILAEPIDAGDTP